MDGNGKKPFSEIHHFVRVNSCLFCFLNFFIYTHTGLKKKSCGHLLFAGNSSFNWSPNMLVHAGICSVEQIWLNCMDGQKVIKADKQRNSKAYLPVIEIQNRKPRVADWFITDYWLISSAFWSDISVDEESTESNEMTHQMELIRYWLTIKKSQEEKNLLEEDMLNFLKFLMNKRQLVSKHIATMEHKIEDNI